MGTPWPVAAGIAHQTEKFGSTATATRVFPAAWRPAATAPSYGAGKLTSPEPPLLSERALRAADPVTLGCFIPVLLVAFQLCPSERWACCVWRLWPFQACYSSSFNCSSTIFAGSGPKPSLITISWPSLESTNLRNSLTSSGAGSPGFLMM